MALRATGTRTDRLGGSDDFKCGLKDIFRDAFYIYTYWCTHLCARESAERFTRLRLSRHSTRLSLCFPPIDAYMPRVVLESRLRYACESSSGDFIFGHRQHIRQHSWIYVAPKLYRCRLTNYWPPLTVTLFQKRVTEMKFRDCNSKKNIV